MDKLNALLADAKAVDAKINALIKTPDLSQEQEKELEGLTARYADLQKAIGREKASQARAKELALEAANIESQRVSEELAKHKAERTIHATAARPLTDPDEPNAKPTSRVRTDEHGRVTGSFEDTDETITLNFSDSKDAVRRKSYADMKRQHKRFLASSGYQPWNEFKNFRDFVRSGLDGHQRQGFQDRVQKHYSAVTGMSEGVGSDGGYLVMPEFAPGIIDRVYNNDNLWARTDNYTVTGNSMTFAVNAETSRANGSRAGGMRGYWLGEGATKTPSKPTFRSVTLKLVKLAVVVYLTDELLQDTGSVLPEYVSRKAADEFNFMIGDALVNGTGVGQPLGLLNWPSLITVLKEAGQLADTLETENIIKMFSRFWGPGRSNMIWLHNQDIEPELFTMTLGVGTGGVVTYMPPGGLSSTPYATLMGRPMIPTEFNPTLGDVGDILAADLGQMLSISKGGIEQAVSIHVEFLTDQTALRFVMRLNAGPWESAAITPYKGTATQSNAVALEAR